MEVEPGPGLIAPARELGVVESFRAAMVLVARHALDILGSLGLLAYGAPTLTYPFGRDHAVFFYVGREWLHGALPYRDVYDIKPPGIHVINAIAILLFGETQWGVRVLELLTVASLAWLISGAVARDRRRRGGETGAIALLLAGAYFTTFTFWETAQAELWESTALVAALALAAKPTRAAAMGAGALVGVAFLFKFPAVLVAIVVAARIAAHAWELRRGGAAVVLALARVGSMIATSAAVAGIAALYFVARGGGSAMVDVLLRHLWDYHQHFVCAKTEAGPSIMRFWFHTCGAWTWMLVALTVFGFVSGWRRLRWRGVRGPLFALVGFALAFGSVLIQRRFFPYHWVVAVVFLVQAAAYGVAEIARRRPAAAFATSALAMMVGYLAPPKLPDPYRKMVNAFAEYSRGDIDRAAYLEPFRARAFSYAAEERLGLAIRARAHDGDMLVVRGHEAVLYVVSGLRTPSRFPVEVPFRVHGLEARADWRAQHERAIFSDHRARFFVTFAWDAADRASLEARGYLAFATEGELVAYDIGG